MLEKLLNFLQDKQIMILGFGMEGQSTYHFLRKYFPEKKLYIADQNTNLLAAFPELIEDIYVEVILGEDYLKDLEVYDLIIKAPGISLNQIDISAYKEKITSQLSLFLEYFSVFTIGVTGTKGKSTTSTLLYQVLKNQGKKTFLLGNIGEPIFNDIEKITSNSFVVLELSSHALEYVKASPNIAILLNIYEEHLDYYSSLEQYIEAKFQIAKYQKESDYFIYNADNALIQQHAFSYKPKDIAISLTGINDKINQVFLKDNDIYYNNEKLANSPIHTKLKGIHMLNNLLFVFAVCHILDLDISKMIETIENFEPLEHRMEYVGNIDGIDYYNDSIATIPEATMHSIKAISNVRTLIVGGKDRGIDLGKLITFLKTCTTLENIICLPKTGEWIYEQLNNTKQHVYLVQTLEEAVQIAKKVTPKHCACLLSPAASSYGYFKNFEERGNLYKKYVNLT